MSKVLDRIFKRNSKNKTKAPGKTATALPKDAWAAREATFRANSDFIRQQFPPTGGPFEKKLAAINDLVAKGDHAAALQQDDELIRELNLELSKFPDESKDLRDRADRAKKEAEKQALTLQGTLEARHSSI